MKNIVLFGPPGAGKGTQAALLVQRYGLDHVSTGDVIREEIRKGSPLGLSVKGFIDRGELAPDQLVIDIITAHVERHRDGVGNIFDGFPRTIAQAEEFDRILASHGLKIDLMLSLDVPDQALIDRITLRAADSGRADDANPEVIKNRIAVYKAQTAVVAGYYEKQGKYVAIDGQAPVELVAERIDKHIDKIK